MGRRHAAPAVFSGRGFLLPRLGSERLRAFEGSNRRGNQGRRNSMARKHLVIAALLMAADVVLIACGGDSKEAQAPTPTPRSAFPLTIEQIDGQQLTLEQAPEHIVSLSTHATEILCAIGAGDQLAAVERYANCPLGSKQKPELDAYQPNLEAIAGYRPDLVYIFSDTDGIVEALRRVGTPVLYLELPSSLEGVLGQIELFGHLSGHENEA